MVWVEWEGEKDLRIVVDGGFLLVIEEGVSIFVEFVEFELEIDEVVVKQDFEFDDFCIVVRGCVRLCVVGVID